MPVNSAAECERTLSKLDRFSSLRFVRDGEVEPRCTLCQCPVGEHDDDTSKAPAESDTLSARVLRELLEKTSPDASALSLQQRKEMNMIPGYRELQNIKSYFQEFLNNVKKSGGMKHIKEIINTGDTTLAQRTGRGEEVSPESLVLVQYMGPPAEDEDVDRYWTRVAAIRQAFCKGHMGQVRQLHQSFCLEDRGLMDQAMANSAGRVFTDPVMPYFLNPHGNSEVQALNDRIETKTLQATAPTGGGVHAKVSSVMAPFSSTNAFSNENRMRPAPPPFGAGDTTVAMRTVVGHGSLPVGEQPDGTLVCKTDDLENYLNSSFQNVGIELKSVRAEVDRVSARVDAVPTPEVEERKWKKELKGVVTQLKRNVKSVASQMDYELEVMRENLAMMKAHQSGNVHIPRLPRSHKGPRSSVGSVARAAGYGDGNEDLRFSDSDLRCSD